MTFDLYTILYIIAIIAEAMTAALLAGKLEMDLVGVFLLGWVTALGGGSIRDVLLNHYPLSWVRHPSYSLITGFAALATIVVARHMHKLRKLFLFLDAIGLVVFTVIGCQIAIVGHLSLICVVISGMITGCMGGVLRDILCNDVPLLFRSELYGTVSVSTAIVFLLCSHYIDNKNIELIIAMIFGITFRLLSIRYNWTLPRFTYRS
ncbi:MULTISPECIES: trimeric intracellular cation channel family protein [Bombella]|uniref:Trimeric intracellular cation channel family protein n=1 Tax=Bombella pollinis TaxID=2967337 RepID=A0ABT3WIU8_9PROT|nr:trimeric intracellular cation channel family protein [Bombella pollinis]MCT6856106.1 trimeric intracellular cation channel family protein [Bombella apis]MCX5618833.1 trimeric intracellular cation channel family protein [Bombella pollinis]MUG04145.1 trimeric intracellular cation channel family protein [Bombella sp. ESL0378]MUG89642.1 trimeric intracellular cation channel family protein [Bombella sp. ESL0385]